MADQQAPIPAPANVAIAAPAVAAMNDDEEINVHLKVKTMLSFKVKRNDKISKLKQLCGVKDGVADSFIDFYCRDEALEGEQTFAENNITNNTRVKLVIDTQSVFAKKLHIIIPSNTSLNAKIIANANDTIHAVKTMVANKAGFNPDEYDLMYNSNVLAPEAMLANLDIWVDDVEVATLYLVKRPGDRGLVLIMFYTPARGVIPLQINKLQSVGFAKAVVGAVTRTGVDNARLMMDEEVLDDTRTIASYNNIVDNVVIHLTYPFRVFVKLYKDRTISLDVMSSDDVVNVNHRVYDHLQLAHRYHPISFRGRRLKLGNSISSYGVGKDSVLYMGRRRPMV